MMKRIGTWVAIALMWTACSDSDGKLDQENIARECSAMLHNYHKDMGEKGLMAEFDYLDSSEAFFWVPPGFTTPLAFTTVRQMVEENARKYATVDLHWEELEVRPVSNDMANFSGVATGSWTDTSGIKTDFSFLESGSLVRRENGWKILSGQTAMLPTAPISEDMITGKMIEKSVLVNCSVEEVWWKWTTHEGLLTFFGPDNKVELRPGGPFEIYFMPDNPEGTKGGEGNEILSYLPKQMLSFTWNAPPKFPEVRNHPHRTWVVVTFNPMGENKTEIKLRHLGWLEGEQWDQVYRYFDSAWSTVLNWLVESCHTE